MYLRIPNGSGFTLVEMLIALAIFSLVSMTAGSLLYQAVEAQNRTTRLVDRLIDVERGLGRVARDITQFVQRDVRDELGDPISSMQILPDTIELTRSGWSNPAEHARSELQRVRYSFREGALQRDYWTVLDRAPETMPKSQRVMDSVEWVGFEPITESHLDQGELVMHGIAEEQTPIGVRVQISVQGYGEVVRVLEIPSPLPEEAASPPDQPDPSDPLPDSPDQQSSDDDAQKSDDD